jgi:translation initiation factor 3 subunit E
LTAITPSLLQVLWGKLACEILVEDWEAASVAVEAVKTAMESMVSSNQMSPLQALSQRTWLLHWSLFVYWNDSAKGGLEQLVELFHTERYKQAITTNAPHLLRYLTAAVLLCKRRVTKKGAAGSNAEARRLMKNLINVMQDCEYTDPIVEFVNCLCVKFDFESAQTKLQECEQVLQSDFFLCRQTALFMEEARVFVFENYCRIHNKIDLAALGKKLAMNQDEAERWIVDLIRNADLDAKIDSEEGCVVMGGSVQSIYEQVMERTRDLNVRSATLAQNLNNVLNEARKEKAKKEQAAREENE